MALSDNLRRAREDKNDEFYTQLADIEYELHNYKDKFKGKTVFCNCDDPYESNFFKYFAMNFNYLGLKKLISTCYVSSPVMYTQLALFDDMEQSYGKQGNPNKKPYKVEITEVSDANGDGAFDLDDIQQLLKGQNNVCTVLKGDGDFRSEECIELLKEVDIVVTNPPFSLLREYVAQLVEYHKKFLIIGNQNATHYKEIFPLIRNNEIWLGYNHVKEFVKPDGTTQKFGNIIWLTNLDIDKRHEDLILYKNYSPAEYPAYENYDAIDVGKVAEIPCDFYGNIGVPDSFLEKYNPSQFEIIGLGSGYLGQSIGVTNIKPEHKKQMTSHAAAGDLYYLLPDGTPKIPYSRVIIRRKEQP